MKAAFSYGRQPLEELSAWVVVCDSLGSFLPFTSFRVVRMTPGVQAHTTERPAPKSRPLIDL